MVPQEHNFQLVCYIEKQITRQPLFHLSTSPLFMEFLWTEPVIFLGVSSYTFQMNSGLDKYELRTILSIKIAVKT